jgi:hypothetical protein
MSHGFGLASPARVSLLGYVEKAVEEHFCLLQVLQQTKISDRMD